MELFSSLTHWHWLVMGILLLIAEVIVSGGFLLWIGIAAIVVSMIVWMLPTLSWSVQLLSFGGGAVLTSVLWWAYLRHHPIATQDPTLNRRSEQYVGRSFILIEPIINGRGKIRVDDSTWTVKGPDLPAGSSVKIVRAEGVILIAEGIK